MLGTMRPQWHQSQECIQVIAAEGTLMISHAHVALGQRWLHGEVEADRYQHQHDDQRSGARVEPNHARTREQQLKR